ncbi:MAG: pilus assembly protein PilM [Lachnospiraceae bacterium]|nr:pilus assembly protein PilM [Lachnospiraceae bacterium]
MAGKVVSIEIGNALTKVALVDYKAKNTKVYNAFVFATPEGTIDDGYIKNSEEFCETLSSKLAEYSIGERRVVFAVSSSKIANREVSLPYVSKDKIMSMVRANATDYFPVDIKNYHLSYQMLEKVITKEERSMKLLLLAAPLDLLETYFDLAKVMGFQLQSIDYAGNAIVQATKNLKKTETNVCIHLNEKNSIISIMENGVLALQRSVAYGSDVAIDAMLNIDKYRYDDSMNREKIQQILLEKQMIDTVMPENDDVAYTDADMTEDERDRAKVTSSFRYLIGNVTRVLDYYMTKTAGARVDVIYISGLGSEYKGLRELLSFEIGSQVKAFKDVEGIIYSGSNDVMTSLPVMIVAIGASKDPMNLMPTEFAQKTSKKISLVGPAAVLIGGIAIAIALIAYGTIAKGIEQKNKEDLQAKKEKMQEYVKIKENYDSSKGVYDNVMTLYGQTQNMNEYLVDFIEELEEKMPESFVAMSLSASSSSVSMSVTCNTYTDAAEVIQQLRKFETLDPMSINASSFTKKVEEEKDENGNPVEKDNDKENDEEDENSTVSFSLSANYNMAYRAQQAAKEKK